MRGCHRGQEFDNFVLGDFFSVEGIFANNLFNLCPRTCRGKDDPTIARLPATRQQEVARRIVVLQEDTMLSNEEINLSERLYIAQDN
jgi:hypothetical protein